MSTPELKADDPAITHEALASEPKVAESLTPELIAHHLLDARFKEKELLKTGGHDPDVVVVRTANGLVPVTQEMLKNGPDSFRKQVSELLD